MATDFSAWASSLVDDCVATSCGTGACLVALTGAGRVTVAVGVDLDDLCRFPLDRLALVPSTYGGMVAMATPRGTTRVVCADIDGGVAVLEGSPGAWEESDLLEARASDHEVLALLWLLMDVRATRPGAAELAARLLIWAWLASPRRGASLAGRDDRSDDGIDCLAAGDLVGLARLVGVGLPVRLDAEGLRTLAESVNHPSLDWDALPWVVTEDLRLDFLHACLPTRWAVADELRTCDGRSDLADLLMSAPTPSGWSPEA